jgi:uncharacterized protein YtpQ (UPF0354 family)
LDNWLSRACAYLKVNLPPEDSSSDLSLSHDDSPVLRDLGNGLLVSYLVDENNKFSYVQNRHLLATRKEEGELHKSAINNLYSLAERHLRIQPYGAVFAVLMEGNFEASVLLLDTVWDISFAKHIREEFIVAVPARDVLAFGDSSSPEAIAELSAIVRRLENNPSDHFLSKTLYRRRNKVWLPARSDS